MNKMKSMFAVLALLVSMASCSNDNTTTDETDDGGLKPIPQLCNRVQQTAAAQQSNEFANKLLSVISEDDEYKGNNVCVAPISMQYIYSIMANGADGDQQKKIVNALGFEDIESLNAQNLALTSQLAPDDEYVQMNFCNNIWADKDVHVFPEFKNAIQQFYNTGIIVDDLYSKTGSQKMTSVVKQWTKEQTNGVIKDFPLTINQLTTMVMINVNCFNAKWATPFDAKKTSAYPFYNIDGKVKNAMMMTLGGELNCYADDSLKMLELPYGQGYYTMMLVMPNKTEFLDEIVKNADWWGWHSQMTKNKVNLLLPRFNITTQFMHAYGFGSKLGMGEALEQPFSKMGTSHNLGYLEFQQIVQAVNIKVDENGTKATATTSGVMGDLISDNPIKSIHFDKPFIFAIRENTTGAILFMGKVVKL